MRFSLPSQPETSPSPSLASFSLGFLISRLLDKPADGRLPHFQSEQPTAAAAADDNQVKSRSRFPAPVFLVADDDELQSAYRDQAAERRNLYGSSSSTGDAASDIGFVDTILTCVVCRNRGGLWLASIMAFLNQQGFTSERLAVVLDGDS